MVTKMLVHIQIATKRLSISLGNLVLDLEHPYIYASLTL